MTSIFAKQALLPAGWANNVLVTISADGHIESVTENTVNGTGDTVNGNPANGTGGSPADHAVGVLLPSPVNAHSHAFQRAMAGLTERRGPNTDDSFWTWRQLMFLSLIHI